MGMYKILKDTRLEQVASRRAVLGYQRANKLSANNNVVELISLEQELQLRRLGSAVQPSYQSSLPISKEPPCKTQYGNDGSRIKITVKGRITLKDIE